MIVNFRNNIMGTISFDGLFKGMRKAQDFIVYPMNDEANVARIQSDKRCGFIDLASGEVKLASGQYNFYQAQVIGNLNAEVLLNFKIAIAGTANKMAGNNGIVYCDNSAAINVLEVYHVAYFSYA